MTGNGCLHLRQVTGGLNGGSGSVALFQSTIVRISKLLNSRRGESERSRSAVNTCEQL